MELVDISGLDLVTLLVALYNNARIVGFGVHDPRAAAPLSTIAARQALAPQPPAWEFGRVDYVQGRVLNVCLGRGDVLDTWDYDDENGAGKAARVIAHLRATGSPAEII